MRTALLLCTLFLIPACAGDPQTEPVGTNEAFLALSQEYLEGFLAFRPVYASRLGSKAHHHDFPDYSPRAVEEEILRIDAFMDRLFALPAGQLSNRNLSDLELLRASLAAWRSRLTQKPDFKRDPLFYNDLIVDGIELLMRRDFASAAERMQAIQNRIISIPYLLEVARVNLTDVPELLREASEAPLVNSMIMFRDNLPLRIRDQMDGRLPEGFEEAHIKAVYAYTDFILFVKDFLKAQTLMDCAIGEGLFLDRWRDEEIVDVSVEAILELCPTSRARVMERMQEAAALIAVDKELAEVLRLMEDQHETVKGVRDRASALVRELREFTGKKDLVDLPPETEAKLSVLEPDPRTNAMLSFMPPARINGNRLKGFFSINPIPPFRKEDKNRNDHLRFFTPFSIALLTAGETFPGKFLQALKGKGAPSHVGKTQTPATFYEGWAHYCRQLIIDEGFDPRPEALLTQLKMNLHEINLLETAARIHCHGLEIEEAVTFLETHSFINAAMARREVTEIVRNPKAGAGFIGREQILKLRGLFLADEEGLTLKQFHERLLSVEPAPITVIATRTFGKEI